jgi:transcription elongation factor GreA
MITSSYGPIANRKRATVSDAVFMTRGDFEALEAEAQQLETAARAEIAQRIQPAREWGDLKENAEYHDAKNDQAMLETKILRLRERLLHAEIRTDEPRGDAVVFGSRVSVLDESSGRETTYTLVAAMNADAGNGKLSIDSPVARALTGARLGDLVSVRTPKGTRQLKVTAIA